jgi:hypothetical protein
MSRHTSSWAAWPSGLRRQAKYQQKKLQIMSSLNQLETLPRAPSRYQQMRVIREIQLSPTANDVLS